jgi:hypothetical protein
LRLIVQAQALVVMVSTLVEFARLVLGRAASSTVKHGESCEGSERLSLSSHPVVHFAWWHFLVRGREERLRRVLAEEC